MDLRRRVARWTRPEGAAELALFLTAIAWGSTFFLTKASLRHVDPVTLVGYRFGLSTLMLFPYVVVWRKLSLYRHWREGGLLGIFLFLLMVSQTVGLSYTRASNSGFITGTSVILVPLIGFLVFGNRLSRVIMFAIVLSLFGLLLLTGAWNGFNRGDAWTLFCAAASAAHIVLIDRFRQRKMDPLLLGLQQFTVTTLLCVALVLWQGRVWHIGGARTGHLVVYLAVVPTLLAYVAQLVAQRYIPPTRAALILVLEAPSAAAFAWTLGREPFHFVAGFGGLLMLVSVIIAERQVRRT